MTSKARTAPPETVCNFAPIRNASRHMTRYLDGCIAHLSLTTSQFDILRLIYRNADININALAALTVMDRTTVGRAIQPLERDGLLTVGVDPMDKRSRLLNLTKAGVEVVEKGYMIWAEAQRVFEAKFGAAEAKAMRAVMQHVVGTELS